MLKKYKLKIISGPANIGEEYILREGQIYELRRMMPNINSNNEIIFIEDEEISKLQAVIRVLPGELIIEDSNSTNGTYVNGARVEQAVLLADYHLRVGSTEFLVMPVDSSGAILFKSKQVYSETVNDFLKMLKIFGDDVLFKAPKNIETKNKLIKSIYEQYYDLATVNGIHRPVVPKIESYHFRIDLENKKTGSKRSYELYRREIIIGRNVSPKEGIILLDKGVSKKHAKITLIHDRQFKIEDLSSANGLFFNNSRVSKVVLKSEESFLISSTFVKVTLLDDIL